MNYKQLLTLTLLFLPLFAISQSSEDDSQAKMLIPFNDHGTWGWCDTLGKIIIKPKYDLTNFFYEQRAPFKGQFRAGITYKGIKNSYVYNKGILIPKGLTTVKRIYLIDSIPKVDLYLVGKDEKLGIYDAISEKLIVKLVYDSSYISNRSYGFVYLKKTGDKTFTKLDIPSKKLVGTDVLIIKKWYHTVRNVLDEVDLFYHRDSTWTQIKNGKHQIVNFDRGLWEEDVDIYFDAAIMDDDFEFPVEDAGEFENDKGYEVLDTRSFRNSPLTTEKYGFKQLYIVSKDGKVGIVTEKDDVIVPLEYDKIEFVPYNSMAKVYKDGKVGLKVFFTSYPIIEAKYDEISSYPRNIRVNQTWNFAVFSVKYQGQDAYVGENGVEYFDL